jgi:hypothetical protein
LEVLKDDVLQAIATGDAATPQQKALTEANRRSLEAEARNKHEAYAVQVRECERETREHKAHEQELLKGHNDLAQHVIIGGTAVKAAKRGAITAPFVIASRSNGDVPTKELLGRQELIAAIELNVQQVLADRGLPEEAEEVRTVLHEFLLPIAHDPRNEGTEEARVETVRYHQWHHPTPDPKQDGEV